MHRTNEARNRGDYFNEVPIWRQQMALFMANIISCYVCHLTMEQHSKFKKYLLYVSFADIL